MKSFFSKKIVVGALVAATVCVSGITDAKAQEFAVQGDIVSSYVWRGHEIRHSEKVLHRILLLGRLINDFDFQSMVRK